MDSRRYTQAQLAAVPGQAYEIVVRVGVVAGSDHAQAQVQAIAPQDRELLFEQDWPHLHPRDAWRVMSHCNLIAQVLLEEAQKPFPDWNAISATVDAGSRGAPPR